ncbi:cation efflux family protein [Niveomyces insectorum RCEF 264]|uniref:Cation efflux family protein n=1 Tax=Niveomyces insectorum RCEF 264 TaxID=1081102 RepID=A0A167Y1X1_9HYPO|nr:cation efflux family protein [Niveomyces insectorum RCEF 264]
MPALRWGSPSNGRALRLHGCYATTTTTLNRRYSHASYQYHDFSQGLRPPQPQTPSQPSSQPSSQRRVYQTFSSPASPSWTASSVAAVTLSSRSPLSLTDLHCCSSSSPFSTFANISSAASTSLSSSFSSSSSASYSRPLAPLSGSFSRKQQQHQHQQQRRKLVRWLPAVMAYQARSHSDDSKTSASHSHSVLGGHHHHHHDNVYLTSQNKKDAGVRITRLGLYCNLGMALAKGAGGYAFNSQSMIADAWHSLTDLASDFLTLATVAWSLRPPTDRFPTGFGKVESLGSLGVSGMLLGGGIFMCLSSLQSLQAHFFLDAAAAAEVLSHGHGHGHSHSHVGTPSLHAAWLAAGTVLVKEWLYRATMKVARERKSSVLASNAVHHRVDSLTGIVTLVAILGANFIRDASWLDPVGGLLISLLVIRAGWENTQAALYELADRSIDDEVKSSVRKYVAKALDGDDDAPAAVTDGQRHLVELRDVSGVKSGQNYLVDLELAVPRTWTVEMVRAIEDAVRTRVGHSVRGVRRVRMRFVTLDETLEKFDDFIPGDVSPRSSPEPEELNGNNGHDHDHDHGQSHDHKHKQ